MADGLSARQTSILKSIIDEYIETALPVGSEALDKRYNLGVSPATIRNEMSQLTDLGYLKQPHTSSGRIPTPKAMKFYVDQLMEEKKLSLTQEVKAKEDVWDYRDNFDHLMQEATHVLANQTKNLAVAATEEGDVWHAGYANLFQNPEFANVRLCSNVFSLLEEFSRLHDLLFNRIVGSSEGAFPVEVLFGEELGWNQFEPIGVVATRFYAGGKSGAIGVIGPMRLNFPTVIPTVRYFRDLIEEVGRI